MSRASARIEPRAERDVVVAAQSLTKVFSDFWMRPRVRAVDAITFQIGRGEVFGLLGPNGSGKSTTIKMILGLLRPTSGRLAVFGKLPTDVAIKKRIGYLPEESYLYPYLNARETLDYYARLFELDHRTRAARIGELLEMVGLDAVAHRQVREYSKGMQRRIGIAQALINDPEFLILDEPTTGLDPIGSRQVKDLILELGRRGKTVLLSSHLLADVEDCVDRLAILYGGKVRSEGTPDDLLVAQSRTVIETDALDDASIEALDHFLQQRAGRHVARVSKPRQTLEELFLDIVDRARAERLETHGAQLGGGTAAFLRAEGEPAEGEALIESLVSGRRDETQAPDAAAHDTPPEPEPPAGPDEGVIGDLVSDAPPEETPAPRANRPAPEPRDSDVDQSMIDSLLRGREGERGPGDEPTERPDDRR